MEFETLTEAGGSCMFRTVVFDTKSYDREQLELASSGLDLEWRFMECRLSAETALSR